MSNCQGKKGINKLFDLIEKYYTLSFVLILVIAGFNLFYNLGNAPVKDWDEARYGVAAFEMIKNKNYIMNTYLDKADYLNSKPPLGCWFIVLSYKTFGYNIFALRFPSAVTAFLTIFFTMVFSKIVFNKNISILSGLILVTIRPFISLHSGRSGEFDALLTFFYLIFIIVLWQHKSKNNNIFLYLIGFVLSLMFLLKSFCIIFPITVLILYLFISKKFKEISLVNYLLFFVIFLSPIILWGTLRHRCDGFNFFQNMISYDVLKRGGTPIEGHTGNIFYYFKRLKKIPWIFVFIAALLYKHLLINKKNNLYLYYQKEPHLLIILAILIPFIIATFVRTKLAWYINPIYPPLAIIISFYIFETIYFNINNKLINFCILIIIFSTFIISERKIIKKELFDKSQYNNQKILLSLKPQNYKKGSTVYSINDFSQSEVFILKVLKNLKFKKIPNINKYIIKGNYDDFLILKNVKNSTKIAKEYNLNIIHANEDWLIMKNK